MIYLISDTHFGHKNIIKYEDRPFSSVEEMDKYMISMWQKVVTKRDRIYHLGDFALTSTERIIWLLKQLPGYKTLILGNHDKRRTITAWRRSGFDIALKTPVILEKKFILSHEPICCDLGDFINIHGHIHSKKEQCYGSSHINISAEVTGYTPILFKTIKQSYIEWLEREVVP